ncbi:ketopantoate reductase PanE/ApbA C terminal-domain-containing protein [Phascolomyces articulosus]|uniref:2-dehydropantoate 2-reductase n=1 Tax=Phascolomyces articulosus TaxID=60185 RepID=A0AAD5K4C9_9FUNG|nr:ketopantoate reductase PanE/ApbA C terminal-domain-containing protein [Phascolomyces articulosus]
MRFHILGTGSVGCNTAFHIRSLYNVTLVLRSQRTLQDFQKRQNQITYRRGHQPELITRGGFDAIVPSSSIDKKTSIDSHKLEAVVVTTKAQNVTEAVSSIKSQLSRSSTLVLLTNGMGIADELLASLWPTPEERQESPAIILGVNRHATVRTEPFSVQHIVGWENPKDGYFLSAYPPSFISPSHETKQQEYKEQTGAVIEALCKVDGINAKKVEWPDLLQRMMSKLVVNCSLNAISGLLEMTTEVPVQNPYTSKIIRSVCDECAQVLTELNTNGGDLYTMVERTALISSGSKTSTFQDMMAKRLTEIEYLNGYLVRLAKERNASVPINQFLLNLLHAKELHIQAS